jgi:hypothetical protein
MAKKDFKFKGKDFCWEIHPHNPRKIAIHQGNSTQNYPEWVDIERYVTGNCQLIALAYFNRLAIYIETPKDFKDFFMALYESMEASDMILDIENIFGGNGYFLLDIEKKYYENIFKKDYETDGISVLDYNFLGSYRNTYDDSDFVYLQIRHEWINEAFDSIDEY